MIVIIVDPQNTLLDSVLLLIGDLKIICIDEGARLFKGASQNLWMGTMIKMQWLI